MITYTNIIGLAILVYSVCNIVSLIKKQFEHAKRFNNKKIQSGRLLVLSNILLIFIVLFAVNPVFNGISHYLIAICILLFGHLFKHIQDI